MAVFTVSATIGISQDFSTIQAFNTARSGDDYVTLTNNTAWPASTAVAVGDLVKNDTPERLYQCITAGTTAGSGGPTGTTSDITDNTAHWAFVCATSGNKIIYEGLITDDHHDISGSISWGTSVTMDDNGFLRLKCKTDASFADDATNKLRYDEAQGAHIHVASHNAKIFIMSANSHITEVQIKSTSSTNAIVQVGTGKLYRCILHTESTQGAREAILCAVGSHVVNNLIETDLATGTTQNGINWFEVGSKVAYNTVVRPSNATAAASASAGFTIHFPSGTTKSCHNNAIFGWLDSLRSTDATPNIAAWDENVTDDDNTNYPGPDNIYDVTYNATTPFLQADTTSGADFRAIASSALDGNGIDLSSDADYPSADVDIFGQSRDGSTPDIGCFEIQAAAGPTEDTDPYWIASGQQQPVIEQVEIVGY